MKILSVAQIQDLDKRTIELRDMTSLELMESAGQSFVNWFLEIYSPEDGDVNIFVGPGNNGGDGLVIGRLLCKQFFEVNIWVCHLRQKFSDDFQANFDRLPKRKEINIYDIEKGDDYPNFDEPGIIIDAILGTGLSHPLEDYWGGLVDHLNEDLSERISIDIPSGMFANKAGAKSIFKADCTFTFEIPKLSFLLPTTIPNVGKLVFGHIGLSSEVLFEMPTDKYLVTEYLVASLIHDRPETGHKGTFGHALLIMGSYGKIGAAILAAKACLRSGTGLVTTHIPRSGYTIMQIAFPEAMVSVDRHEFNISEFPNIDKYQAIGIGCGMGTNQITQEAMLNFLGECNRPLLLDADALNIFSLQSGLLRQIPKDSILTPHPGEFIRLFGKSANDFERIKLLQKWATELEVYILLKGSRSCLACPNGELFFNASGNSGMATAGSGDVLSGIITGLLAQGYSSQHAAILGMYLHGVAGDIASQKVLSEEAMIASDIIDNIGMAYEQVKEVLN